MFFADTRCIHSRMPLRNQYIGESDTFAKLLGF